MPQQKEIVIAGAGLAGLSLAEKLTGTTDAHITLIAPYITPDNVIPSDKRLSTPIVPAGTIRRLGLDISNTPEVRRTFFGPTPRGPGKRLIGRGVQGFFDGRFNKEGFYAIDAETARQEVLTRVNALAQETDQLSIQQGTVFDLQKEKGRVTGVLIRDQEMLHADLVVDATGKSASLANKLEPHEREVIKLPQPGSLIGGYLALDMEELAPRYPGIESLVYLDILPGKVAAVLTPAQKIPNSPATHGILIEGDQQYIQEAYASVSNKYPPAERQLLVLQALAKGTPWHDILSHTKSLDRVVVYHHKANTKRTPLLPGIVFHGDAHGFISPINGTGLSYAARDTERLTDALTTSDLDAGAAQYTKTMQTIFERRFTHTKRFGVGIRVLGEIFKSI